VSPPTQHGCCRAAVEVARSFADVRDMRTWSPAPLVARPRSPLRRALVSEVIDLGVSISVSRDQGPVIVRMDSASSFRPVKAVDMPMAPSPIRRHPEFQIYMLHRCCSFFVFEKSRPDEDLKKTGLL